MPRVLRSLLPFLVALLCFLVGSLLYRKPANSSLRLVFLDVGQGDSSVIETPTEKVIVIDTGDQIREGEDDMGRRVVAPYLRSRGIHQIDLLILTHPDSDHIGGAKTLLEQFRVGMILENGQDSPLILEIRALAKSKGVPIHVAQSGQSFDFGGGVLGEVLAPFPHEIALSENDKSIVFRLTYQNNRFLFMGDAETNEETLLLAKDSAQTCTLLKVGHHGIKTSTSLEFLRKAHPRYALISCGKRNRFGHPHPDVMERLKGEGVQVFRTDIQGAIVCTTKSQQLQCVPQLSPSK